jgi:hypothetical protein
MTFQSIGGASEGLLYPRADAGQMAAGKAGKIMLGVLMLAIGVAILTGWDKRFEAWAVDASPAWLTDLTTRY